RLGADVAVRGTCDHRGAQVLRHEALSPELQPESRSERSGHMDDALCAVHPPDVLLQEPERRLSVHGLVGEGVHVVGSRESGPHDPLDGRLLVKLEAFDGVRLGLLQGDPDRRARERAVDDERRVRLAPRHLLLEHLIRRIVGVVLVGLTAGAESDRQQTARLTREGHAGLPPVLIASEGEMREQPALERRPLRCRDDCRRSHDLSSQAPGSASASRAVTRATRSFHWVSVGKPSAPSAPSAPAAPVSPFAPFAPVSPFGPFGPSGPCGPSGPWGPSGPGVSSMVSTLARTSVIASTIASWSSMWVGAPSSAGPGRSTFQSAMVPVLSTW